MKRTPLKRKTRLNARSGFKRHTIKPKPIKRKKRSRSKKPSIRLLKSKLWNECKRIIRARHGNVCYSCGAQGLEGSNWQTGHFIASSCCSTHMRYNLNNLRPQCMRCNIHMSGNWVPYEAHLKKDGIDVEALKQENEDTKNEMYRADWYEAKIAEYKLL